MNAPTRNVKRLKIVLSLTGVYLVAEVVGGILTHSLALLADAGHMLTDVGGIAMALAAIHFARKPATLERTYGFYTGTSIVMAGSVHAEVDSGIAHRPRRLREAEPGPLR